MLEKLHLSPCLGMHWREKFGSLLPLQPRFEKAAEDSRTDERVDEWIALLTTVFYHHLIRKFIILLGCLSSRDRAPSTFAL